MTPKEQFHARNPAKVQHLNSILSDGSIEEALHVAFNQLCWDQPSTVEVGSAVNLTSQRQGAKALISIFLNLAVQPQERKPVTAGLLEREDHHVRTSSSTSGTKPNTGIKPKSGTK